MIQNLTPIPKFDPNNPARTEGRWQLRLDRFPPLFLLSTKEELPPRAMTALLEQRGIAVAPHDRAEAAMGWIIAGDIGSGKTRLACLLALERAAATWAFPAYLSAAQIRAKAFSDWGAADKIVEAACKADVLVLDDLGKGAPGATIDELIFSILDHRTGAMRPTIITTQYAPDALKTRFKERETADAIMRRIQQFHIPIIL